MSPFASIQSMFCCQQSSVILKNAASSVAINGSRVAQDCSSHRLRQWEVLLVLVLHQDRKASIRISLEICKAFLAGTDKSFCHFRLIFQNIIVGKDTSS